MPQHLRRLAAPALAAAACLGAAAPAHASAWPSRHHDVVQGSATSPGIEPIPLTLPSPSYTVHNSTQLKTALQSAQPGQVIQLASGSSYQTVWDTKARSGWVTVSGAGDAVAPQIDGAQLAGSQYLRFTNVLFTHKVFVGRNPTSGSANPAENVQILNSEVNCGSTETNPKTAGIEVRQASQNVTIAGDYVHNCTVGLTTSPTDNPNTNLTIIHNDFQYFYGDAIDLGGSNNTVIEDNVIRDIAHTAGCVYHDDGIQFLGNTTGTTIQDNVLSNSNDQLIFIQDAIAGEFNGVQLNSNILIDHNLVYGVNGAAVQDEGAVNLQFLNNTVWDGAAASLIVRKSPYTGTSPSQSTFEGNIIESYEQMGAPGSEGDNLIEYATKWTLGQLSPTDILGQAPTFVDPAAGDFALAPGSAGYGSGAVEPATQGTSSGSGTGQLGASPVNFPYGAPVYGAGAS